LNKDIALIGCGRIGTILEEDKLRYKPCTHSGGAKSAGLKINYACDTNKSRLENFAKKTNILKTNSFLNHKNLLKKVIPHVVIIATHIDSHEEITLDFSNAGTKIVVLEKPISYNIKSAKKIITTCQKNNTTLIINHERRYDSRYRKVKEMLDANSIGDILSIKGEVLTSGRIGKSFEKNGGGPLLHDGTHLVDIIRFFVGDFWQIDGDFQRGNRKEGFEDYTSAFIKTKKNKTIFIEAGKNRNFFSFSIEISGSNGKIIIGNGFQKLFLPQKSKFYEGFKDLVETDFPEYKENNSFTELYTEVKHIIEGKNNSPTSSGKDGYKALEIIHSIYLSAYKNKKITLPIKQKNINIKKIFNLKK